MRTRTKTAQFRALLLAFALEYHEALSFLAGWTAYPIGAALLSLLAGQ